MRTVITGGAGFIGSHLCERLLSEEHEVVCVDSLITGSRENLAGIEGSPLFTFVESDVSETLDGRCQKYLSDWYHPCLSIPRDCRKPASRRQIVRLPAS